MYVLCGQVLQEVFSSRSCVGRGWKNFGWHPISRILLNLQLGFSLSGQPVPYSDGRAGSASLHVFWIKNRFCQGRQVGGPGSLTGSSRAGPGLMMGPVPGTASRLHALVLLCLDYRPGPRGGPFYAITCTSLSCNRVDTTCSQRKKVKSICSCIC